MFCWIIGFGGDDGICLEFYDLVINVLGWV